MAPLLRISTGASMSMHHILSTTRRTVIGFTTRPAVTTRRTVVPTVKALSLYPRCYIPFRVCSPASTTLVASLCLHPTTSSNLSYSTSAAPLGHSKQQTSQSNKLAIVMVLLLATAGVYAIMSSTESTTSNNNNDNTTTTINPNRQDLPPVTRLLSDDQVTDILTRHQRSMDPSLAFSESQSSLSSESHTPIFRIDANSVASNTPIEDYYAHAKFGNGILLGMFDGHGGPECGRIVSKYLLSYIAKAITDLNLKKQEPGMERTADHHRAIKHAIKTAFVRLDTDIINGAFTTSGNIAAEVVSRGTIASWILGLAAFSRNECLASLRTSLSGACALVAYIDGDDVYVACTGDCRAVLARRVDYSEHRGKTASPATMSYISVPLSADQTFKNPKEYARLVDDHPGEDVIIKGRILGGLMPTRAFGDARYKWTKYQQRVILPSLYPDGRRGIPRNYKTPPYVTAEPEVIHYERDTHDEFLIMATDGLWDEVTSDISAQLVGDKFGRGATKDSASAVASATDAAVVDVGANAASVLVWSALSDGDTVPDNDRIRHILSISNGKSRRYRDDITVNVAYFGNGSSEHYGESGLRKPIPGAVGIPMVDLGLAKPKHHHLTSWVEFLKHQPTQSSGYPTSKL
ncbi:hypothetical protein BASA50_006937 [Batrachochytrium salamandrivorans]|uniref:PPM-type phosphatase domain-containing protein n=1 Tax=Batrachochytrium salamandrivorans TaxID=1357716 RepID=A0ABQ8F8G9_9FUNG|nr:hypothetical protein BASA50_006937 [Batrachochytrium salamandrivorans]